MDIPGVDFLNSLVGLVVSEATTNVMTAGFKFRRTRTNGSPHIGTQDYNPRRINVWVVAGKITRAYAG